MQKPILITVKNLTKVYADPGSAVETPALVNVSMEIEEGDFAAVTGPSGSGKTTLLNIIGTLDKPTSGDVTVAGTALAGLSPDGARRMRAKSIGFIFSRDNLIPTLTAYENAQYLTCLQGVPADRRKHETLQVLNDLGLLAVVHSKPCELNALQQQKTALARTILARPKIILADEPTSRLDSKASSELMDLMKNMNRNLDIAFLFATHDKAVAEKAKTVFTLCDGKIVTP